ncbi:MAG: major capsid protein [Pyrinomonadaceae bacterium]|nr:major capsid protein [Pyrinomonadaceae bacterium]
MPESFINTIEGVTSADLTVRAQRLPEDNNGTLLWNVFFPRRDVNSITIADIMTVDERFVADYREWNAPERRIPLLTPDVRNFEMTPIGADFLIGEREMQKLAENTNNNQQIISELIGGRVPDRTDGLIRTIYRRLELAAFEAWLKGTVTATNPQTGATYTASYGIDASRLVTEPTVWTDAGVNAYDLFISRMETAIQLTGGIRGAATRLKVIKAIQADAPLINNRKMTRGELTSQIQDELGSEFAFFPIENQLKPFTDGGTVTATVDVFEQGYLAAIPQANGGAPGYSAFAPVRRAMDLAAEVPEANIDVNGVSVFSEGMNQGKTLSVQAQANAMAIPDEQLVYVVDTLIA